jgi:hypothetical protein
MTPEQIEHLVTSALKINTHKTRQICGIKGKCTNISTFVGHCLNSDKITWRLLRFCIFNRIYPNCAVCKQPIKITNPHEPQGLTKGHIISKFNGGKNIVTNLNPEHLECNMSHQELDWIIANYQIGLSITIKIEYSLGGTAKKNFRNEKKSIPPHNAKASYKQSKSSISRKSRGGR